MNDYVTERLNTVDIEEYIARLDDLKAERQASWRPLHQASYVFKWILGYSWKRTMQHNKEANEAWKRIMDKTKRYYGIFSNDDVDPTKLAEMNLYAIELMKDEEMLWK